MPHLVDVFLPQVAEEVATGFLSVGARGGVHLDNFLVPVGVATLVDGVQFILGKQNLLGARRAGGIGERDTSTRRTGTRSAKGYTILSGASSSSRT